MLRLYSFKLPRPLFTWPELWYHLLWLPVVYPVAGGVLIGSPYFSRLDVFVIGTLTMLAMHTVYLLILTVLVKMIIHQNATVQRAQWRNWMVLGVGSLVSAFMAVGSAWVCSQIPLLQAQFSPRVALYMAGVGGVSALLMGYVLILTDTYGRWRQHQAEKERFRQLAMRQQLDALTGQINPHFLFNSLNSISSLIADEPHQAEIFVDQMAQVYRYLLQAHTRAWVSLEQETQFARSYAQLLMVRYRGALIIQINVPPSDGQLGVLPLTFQYLLDDILQHHTAQVNKPLRIEILSLTDGQLQIRYNRQPRILRVKAQQAGFNDLVERYELAGVPPPRREVNTEDERVGLPLIPSSFNANVKQAS